MEFWKYEMTVPSSHSERGDRTTIRTEVGLSPRPFTFHLFPHATKLRAANTLDNT